MKHGMGGYASGCRCDTCRTAKAEYRRRLSQRLAGDPRTPHGTVRGYKTWCCRCADCTQAHRESERRPNAAAKKRARALAQRDRNMAKTPQEHGYSAYVNFACRCDICSQAARDHIRHAQESDRRAQGEALKSAVRSAWTGPELEIVARNDLDLRSLAQMLGRTVGAIKQARYRIRHEPKWMQHVGLGSDH